MADLESPEKIYRRAVNYHASGELEQARVLYRLVEYYKPDNPMLLNMYGLLALNFGELDVARYRLAKSVELLPDYPEALNHLGLLHLRLKEPKKAEGFFLRALALVPNFVNAMSNLSGLYEQEGDRVKAIDYAERVLVLDSDHIQTRINLAVMYLRDDRLLESETLLESVIASGISNSMVLTNLGIAKVRLGKHQRGRELYKEAIAQDPGALTAHEQLALDLLRHREFQQGWNHYEYRNRGSNLVKIQHLIPAGRTLDYPSEKPVVSWEGLRVHVISEQGLGDELFFLRYLPEVVRRGAAVSYASTKRITPLISQWAEENNIQLGTVNSTHQIDRLFAIGDLPLALKSDDYPTAVKLSPKSDLVKKLTERYGSSKRPWVGITRRAGTNNSRTDYLYKELPSRYLEDILSVCCGTFFDFTRIPDSNDDGLKGSMKELNWIDVSEMTNDLEQTVALLALLDDYIGVSNTNIHLLAGLGKKAHVYIPFPADFRWFVSGASEWFPGFHVVREEVDEK